MKNNEIYLRDILENISKIEEYIKDLSLDNFERTPMAQEAVAFDLAVIGEAANNISKELRESNPQIPWRKIVNLRNVLIHDYSRIDFQSVWKVSKEDLPELKEQVEEIVKKL